jgi:hypothetical protein
VDYEKAKQEALGEKEALTKRREEIDQETARLKRERSLTERRLVGLKQVLEGLTIMTTEGPAAPPPPEPPPVMEPPPSFIRQERHEPPPRKALPFPISFVAGLVVKKDHKVLDEPHFHAPGNGTAINGNGTAITNPQWDESPAPPRIEPRQDKREWLG